jgi:drug/metabolite transporter (DMT)-like permease
MLWLALVILAGGILGPLLLMFGLARTSAAGTSLLLSLEGLATMVIAWVAFRENVDRRLFLGALAILAGAVLLSWQGQASFQWGALLIAGACLCWGIDNNLTRKLSSADPVQIAMLKGLVAGVVSLALALLHGALFPSLSILLAVTIVGFLGYGVSLALFVPGLRYLGSARTGAYFSLAPFVGAVLAVLMLGDPLSAKLLIAGGLMGIGLWVHLAGGTNMIIRTTRWSTSTAIAMMSTTSTRMVLTRLRASRMRIGIGTRPWSTAIPIIRICVIATGTSIRLLKSGEERR